MRGACEAHLRYVLVLAFAFCRHNFGILDDDTLGIDGDMIYEIPPTCNSTRMEYRPCPGVWMNYLSGLDNAPKQPHLPNGEPDQGAPSYSSEMSQHTSLAHWPAPADRRPKGDVRGSLK